MSIVGTPQNLDSYKNFRQKLGLEFEMVTRTTTYEGSGNLATSTQLTTSQTPTLPAGRQNDDLLVLMVAHRLTQPTYSGLSSWTKFSQNLDGLTSAGYSLYYLVVDGTESAPTITWSSGSAFDIVMSRIHLIRGVDVGAAIPLSFGTLSSNTSSTSVVMQEHSGSIPSGSLIIEAMVMQDDISSLTGSLTDSTGNYNLFPDQILDSTTLGNDMSMAIRFAYNSSTGNIDIADHAYIISNATTCAGRIHVLEAA
jgi:hypothetical protein